MNTSLTQPTLPSPLRWPEGTCRARVPLCCLGAIRKNSIAEQDYRHINRLMSRLGVGGLAKALGTTIQTLDRWVCGQSYFGVRPQLAADMAERFLWLLRHEDNYRNRCACRICVHSRDERFHHRIWRSHTSDPQAIEAGPALWCRGQERREEVSA